MTFLAPMLLLGLLLVPILLGLYVLVQRRRTRYAVRFTNLDLLANLAPKRPAWRRHVPAAIYLVAISLLAIGLARPTMVLAVPREDSTVLLAIDVSGSMTATDVAPTRLAAAKAAAHDFVQQLPAGIRVGIVSFASQPKTLIEPTADHAALDEAIDTLKPRDGTAMGDALMQVLDMAEAIKAEDGASASPAPTASGAPVDGPSGEPLVAAILLSDGAQSVGEAEPLDAANRAASLGVPVYTIALGTPEGKIQVRDDNGQLVTLDVPPDTETLAQIAEVTGAQAFDASTATDLSAVYDNLQSRVGYTQETQEVTYAFAAAALVLVVLGAGMSALWFGRLP
jgi:Ca-activated chloride channel homolog